MRSVRFSGPGLVLDGAAVVVVDALARRGLRAMQADGLQVSAEVAHLLDLISRSAAEVKRAEVRVRTSPADIAPDPPASSQQEERPPVAEPGERLTAQEAAAVLRMTDRHVRRIADQIGGSVEGGRFFFDRAMVETVAASRSFSTNDEEQQPA